MKKLALLLLIPISAFGHGLSPSRLEAASGSPLIAYRFTATNNYSQTFPFTVQCFKNDLNHPYECKSLPTTFYVAPKGSRKFKVQIAPDSDGVYLVCTLQDIQAPLVSRVCARFGVGVSPSVPADGNRKHSATANPVIPSGSRQGKGG